MTSHGSNHPNRKKGKSRGGLPQGRCVRDLREQVGGKGLREARGVEYHRKPGFRRTGRTVDAAVAVLCVGQHEDVRGAAAVVVVMVVVGVVAVVVDGFAGSVAQHPDEMPAAVFVAAVDAETCVRENVGKDQQSAAEESRCLFHWRKSKEYCLYLQNVT